MGELGALFNPGMRHELEERRSKAARREEEGNARDADLRIDLESGVAVINIPGAEDEPAPVTAPTDTTSTAATPPAAESPAPPDSAAGRSPEDGRDPEGGASTDGGPDATSLPSSQQAPSPQAPTAGEGSAPPAPEPLRPRGKRGMSTTAR